MSDIRLGQELGRFQLNQMDQAVDLARRTDGDEALVIQGNEIVVRQAHIDTSQDRSDMDTALRPDTFRAVATSDVDPNCMAFVVGRPGGRSEVVANVDFGQSVNRYCESNQFRALSPQAKVDFYGQMVAYAKRDGRISAAESETLKNLYVTIQQSLDPMGSDQSQRDRLMQAQRDMSTWRDSGVMVVPGGNLSADGSHFADPVAMIRSLDQSRLTSIPNRGNGLCGPYAALEAAILRGPQAVQRLAQNLGVRVNLQDGLSKQETVQMAEALYRRARQGDPGAASDPGTDPARLAGVLRASGAWGTVSEGNRPAANALDNMADGETRVISIDAFVGRDGATEGADGTVDHAIQITRRGDQYVVGDSGRRIGDGGSGQDHGRSFNSLAEAQGWLQHNLGNVDEPHVISLRP